MRQEIVDKLKPLVHDLKIKAFYNYEKSTDYRFKNAYKKFYDDLSIICEKIGVSENIDYVNTCRDLWNENRKIHSYLNIERGSDRDLNEIYEMLLFYEVLFMYIAGQDDIWRKLRNE